MNYWVFTFFSLILVVCGDDSKGKLEILSKKKRSIDCHALTQCPWQLWLHYIYKKCQPVYDSDSCCPVSFNCQAESIQLDEDTETSCQYNDKTYSHGDVIEIKDKCISCICNKEFNENQPVGSNCQPLNCKNEEIDEKVDKGCIPLYKNDKCCPADWQCPPNLNTKFRQGGEETRPTTNDPHKQCYYGGQNYPLGFDLVSAYVTGINCTCVTPPSFTCTIPSCPQPQSSSDETLRCTQKWPLGNFCPQYECWSVFQETDHIGSPQTIKEKDACKNDHCPLYNECVVNYTQCHLDVCEKRCLQCAVPSCAAWSKYESPVNECPRCSSYKTPEEICELNPTFCPEEATCGFIDIEKCRKGYCDPVCKLRIIEPQIMTME